MRYSPGKTIGTHALKRSASCISRTLSFAFAAICLSGLASQWVHAAEQDLYDGVTAGFTDEGLPYIGEPNAPVTLVEYSDYLCPFCNRHYEQTFPELIDTYVRPGNVKIVFRDFPIEVLHPQAPLAAEAARCFGGCMMRCSSHAAAGRRALHPAIR